MIVYYLLDNGADLNYSGGRLNEIPLQWAVRNEKYVIGLTDSLLRLLRLCSAYKKLYTWETFLANEI